MRPTYQERHMDYVLGPLQDGRLATVAAGQRIEGLALQLDLDAPFVLRSRAIRVKNDINRVQDLRTISTRFAGPDRDYRSQALIPQAIEMAYCGQDGLPLPLNKQIVYPPGGVILVDVQNTGLAAVTNLTLYFRGVKLFKWGQIPSFTYPNNCRTLPFQYPQLLSALPVTTPTMGVRYIFTVKDDADFAFRAIQAGRSFNDLTHEVFITLLDQNQKPYSNSPVHIDVMAGQVNGGSAAFPTTSNIAAGPSNPGLLYPEIYLPRNQILYYDVVRADVSFAGAAAVDYFINFIGAKVFAQ